MKLPFNLIVTAKISVTEQFESPPFWKSCWRHDVTVHTRKTREFRRDNISSKMVECAVVGCSNRTPRDSKRGIGFHRLSLENKPLLKKWLVGTKGQICPNLVSATSGRSTLRKSLLKVAVISIPAPAENVNDSWTTTLSRRYFPISKKKQKACKWTSDK